VRLERLLADSAERHPDRVAIKDERAELSYGEIDDLANRTALALKELGVRPGDRIGVWLHKSAEAVAVMQAALRLGAAYVPVDPMSPPARAATIMRDCRIAALVAPGERGRSVLDGELANVPLLSTDASKAALTWADLEGFDGTPVSHSGAEDDLAYILYTSGSTGVPKGVCISHRNALAFVDWAAREVGAGPEDRFSNHAPFHFDLSVFDLYAAFRCGGCVVIVPEQHAYVPEALVDLVSQEQITVWYSVPSALILMVERGDLLARSGLALRAVVFAGEPYPINPLRRLRDGLPHVRLFNWYGPTETNVCTGYEVRGIAPRRDVPVPIGHKASGDRVWAVKDDGSEAGVGEEGELLVWGPTVSLGYWGGTPQGDEPYRTGDIVRLEADGEYAYVGRRDHMVKIRGHRVELGEVEAALLTHPAIEDAAVTAVGSGISARLVAFVAVRGEPPTLLEIKRHCAERLPRHMIVNRAVSVDRLPRTRNGKIDRLELKRRAEEEGRDDAYGDADRAQAVRRE
jgi:amino acid adenylation domain-containing protein